MKSITSNSRAENQFALLHLFKFEMHDFEGALDETLYFTDHDIFVEYEGNSYTPLAITFDRLVEDLTMQSSSINIMIDNINGALSSSALTQEWRNNPASITRVIYTPESESPVDGETYTYGYGDALDTYPKLNLSSTTKDVYELFSGLIDSFSATENAITGSIATQFVHWTKPIPSRTYNQNEFSSIIDAITKTIWWGSVKPE